LAFSAVVSAALAASSVLADAQLQVDAAHPSHAISPLLYGLMTEEINHAYDGGLYAELVRNRSLKEGDRYWSLVQDNGALGTMTLDKDNSLNDIVNASLKITANSASKSSRVGIANEGFWGIPVKPNSTYHATFYAKCAADFSGAITVSIENNDGQKVWAKGNVQKVTGSWAKYSVTLKTPAKIEASSSNRFVVSLSSPGSVWLSFISLFPPTYNNETNGKRVDLMEKLAALHPAFVRFPGGCFVEGSNFEGRFDWKKTIGDVSLRPGHVCPSNYPTSDGMGILEFMTWCEDLHAEPVVAVYAGLSMNNDHFVGKDLEPYVQDALDEIEYISGDASTKWGAKRVADGHPKPLPVKYVEIGNEDFTDRTRSYDQRFTQFYDAIKAKYPSIKVIATISVKTRKPDILDDHYYLSRRDMYSYVDHYSNWSPTKPAGEWATVPRDPTSKEGKAGHETTDLTEAIADAAWMTGLERNSDVVQMACYAPLFVRYEDTDTWKPDLISYNGLISYGGPSYYAQCMFSNNKGDVVLPVTLSQSDASDPPAPTGGIGVGAWNTQVQYKDIKVVSGDKTLYAFDPAKPDYNAYAGEWSVQDGALTQSGRGNDLGVIMGDKSWKDYTLTLKARKTGGDEGFLVVFHANGSQDLRRWNIGGWGNRETSIELKSADFSGRITDIAPYSIENDRWYDLRVEVKGKEVKCFVDGQLVLSTVDNGAPQVKTIYATASKDTKSGDIIIKAVNTTNTPQPLHLAINGSTKINRKAHLILLTGQANDVNSIDEPEKVKPVASTINNASNNFIQTLPANSVSVIRLSTNQRTRWTHFSGTMR
jgi:alpha-L-arabinofuranosidase